MKGGAQKWKRQTTVRGAGPSGLGLPGFLAGGACRKPTVLLDEKPLLNAEVSRSLLLRHAALGSVLRVARAVDALPPEPELYPPGMALVRRASLVRLGLAPVPEPAR